MSWRWYSASFTLATIALNSEISIPMESIPLSLAVLVLVVRVFGFHQLEGVRWVDARKKDEQQAA